MAQSLIQTETKGLRAPGMAGPREAPVAFWLDCQPVAAITDQWHSPKLYICVTQEAWSGCATQIYLIRITLTKWRTKKLEATHCKYYLSNGMANF